MKVRDWDIPIQVTELGADLLDWKSMPIQESGEPLVEIAHERLLGRARAQGMDSQYSQLCREGGIDSYQVPYVLVRKRVGERLDAIQCYLDRTPGLQAFQLIVLDGVRDLKTQGELYGGYLKHLAAKHTEWGRNTLEQEAQKMVSAVPSRKGLQSCPPHHATGGAVDVMLVKRNIDFLPHREMFIKWYGSEFDEVFNRKYGDKRSALTFYESRGDSPQRRARRRLWYVMTQIGGFTAYSPEWWHYQVGNQLDAYLKNHAFADYGYVGKPDIWAVERRRRAQKDRRWYKTNKRSRRAKVASEPKVPAGESTQPPSEE